MAEDTIPSFLLSELLAPDELDQLLQRSKEADRSFWEILLEEKGVSEEWLAELFSRRLRVPRVRLAMEPIDRTGNLIPEALARRYLCLPLRLREKKLVLCLANPADLNAIREVEFHTGWCVSPVVATRSEIREEIERYYADPNPLADIAQNTWETQELEWFEPESPNLNLDEGASRRAAEEAPVVRLANLIIAEALTHQASDIHIEPSDNGVRVRNRVDGLLRDVLMVPKWIHAGLVSRIKILANLDISERRRAQDGQLGVRFRQQPVQVRVSTLPTRDGEKVVLRVLGAGHGIPSVSTLGLEPEDAERLLAAVAQPQGMILVTGPTGSGKTTALYSALAAKKTPELNIVTIEDPIEYHLDEANQVQVNPRAGMTFANCLRSILRQDPDVILVGEIRDQETAEIAFHAAMTGHMVLSSLHTNTALGSIYRLLELGIEPFLVSSCVNLVMAQRLVRKVCQNCCASYAPSATLLKRLAWGDQKTKFVRGTGCSECSQTGYLGRTGLFELLPFTPEVQEALNEKANEGHLLKVARASGMRLLLEDAIAKIKKGVTTVEEVVRVTYLREEAVSHCPGCRALVRPSYSACPYCLTQFQYLCSSCGQELKKGWKICPYCNRKTTLESAGEGERRRWLQ
ncbi:MAG: ATPase, T2SS/T4P/T4SS family [Terriglobia bacterium]